MIMFVLKHASGPQITTCPTRKRVTIQLWQAFVGVRDCHCRVNTYYQELLAFNQNGCYGEKCDNSISETTNSESSTEPGQTSEKWKGQIEKDLLRTFPGHPTLDEDGRNALRRLLTAYARHNPSVGYCQVLGNKYQEIIDVRSGGLHCAREDAGGFYFKCFCCLCDCGVWKGGLFQVVVLSVLCKLEVKKMHIITELVEDLKDSKMC